MADPTPIPIAVVGLSCRLPGHISNPTALWDFLENGRCADTGVPASRFNLKGHYDGSHKSGTMKSPGGMFLEGVDPRDFDAQFFGIPTTEAVAMDPQQRQLLEVVYEGLENAGITLESLRGQPFGCFVGSYASDHSDIQARNPEEKPAAFTIGTGRAMLSNRISHFLDIHGASMTIDTACSGSLVAVDVACHYLRTGQIQGAVVAACNMYLNPEHAMDASMAGAISDTGRCHTFDIKADGYVKAEAANAVILKRLDDALKDRDPVRAVIRGSATNSDGRTVGIASPSSAAQAKAIRTAYSNAGIHDYSTTFDFEKLKVQVTTHTIPWPSCAYRRACVNSFGYGGSNAVVVLDEARHFLKAAKLPFCISSDAEEDIFPDEGSSERPYLLVVSANDKNSLLAYQEKLYRHLIDPHTNLVLRDLAYTLSERKTRFFHRSYAVSSKAYLGKSDFIHSHPRSSPPRIGFVFTGQEELMLPRSSETIRSPEFAQPLLTALQLSILGVFNEWNIRPNAVVGHSSGEIAAAACAGLVSPTDAIKIAYYRGKAVAPTGHPPAGMLATGLGDSEVREFLAGFEDSVDVACINGPESTTLSGHLTSLERIQANLRSQRHFARLLQVDLPYHSRGMREIATHYRQRLDGVCNRPSAPTNAPTLYSSVTGKRLNGECDSAYWERNMASPVLFSCALESLLSDDGADMLIEIGPSAALAGPITQILKSLPADESFTQYYPALNRGSDGAACLLDIAGHIYTAGGPVNMAAVNKDHATEGNPSVIVDLPNYHWNHSIKYWQESEDSKDWRFRMFPPHDLLGSKVLGTSWEAPSWKATIRLQELPWLTDHKLGDNVVMPAAGYLAMAVEAMFQQSVSTNHPEKKLIDFNYRLRDVYFHKALIFDGSTAGQKVMLTLNHSQHSWYEFRIHSLAEGQWIQHCKGLISLVQSTSGISPESLQLLRHTTPAQTWYKTMAEYGYRFGPCFQKQLAIESFAGCRRNRTLLSLAEVPSMYAQSTYLLHPTSIDGCLQSGGPSLWKGHRSSINALLIPAVLDEVTFYGHSSYPEEAVAVSSATYSGQGPTQRAENYANHTTVYSPITGVLLMQVSGLHYQALSGYNRKTTYTYLSSHWRPDIDFLTEKQLGHLTTEIGNGSSMKHNFPGWLEVDTLLDLISHKKPNSKVAEITFGHPSRSLWMSHHPLTTTDTHGLQELLKSCSSSANIYGDLVDLENPGFGFAANETDFDVLILQLSPGSERSLTELVQAARAVLSSPGWIVVVNMPNPLSGHGFSRGEAQDSTCSLDQSPGKVDAALQTAHWTKNSLGCFASGIMESNGFCNIIKLPDSSDGTIVGRWGYYAATRSDEDDIAKYRQVDLVHAHGGTALGDLAKANLVQKGWDVSEETLLCFQPRPKSIVVLIDDCGLLTRQDLNKHQWTALQKSFMECNPILWVTIGSQLGSRHPHNASIFGFARTARSEDPTLRLAVLDLESTTNGSSIDAIHAILKGLQNLPLQGPKDTEFVERAGLIYINRVQPSDTLIKADEIDTRDADSEHLVLHESQSCVRLVCPRKGALDALCFEKICQMDTKLEDDFVEVDIKAAGLNFKVVIAKKHPSSRLHGSAECK
ncbi:MAG: hypothetical protein Q9207_003861 [Kuettlingeria erythrocarpa]